MEDTVRTLKKLGINIFDDKGKMKTIQNLLEEINKGVITNGRK